MLKPHLLFSIYLVAALCLLPLPSSPFVKIALAQTAPVAGTGDRDRGIELYNQKKFADAVKLLKTAVKKDKNDYRAWHFLGLAEIEIDKIKDATKSLQNVVKLQPSFAPGHTGLSYTALLRNKSSEAIRGAELALGLDPKIAEAHYIIGIARLRTGNKEEALKHAEAAIKIDPKFSGAYLLKSQALVDFLGDVVIAKEKESTDDRNARYLEAATALEKYLELEPNTKQKQTWRDQLESLRFHAVSHGDDSGSERVYSGKEVTTKARVLAMPEPKLTGDARSRGVTGTVVLRCILAADGTVRHLLVVEGLPYGLTEAALTSARRIKFTPATIDGKPVSMFIQLEYNFNLY